jgi:hypothetical protein
METYYQIHRSTAITALLVKEKQPLMHTNIQLGDLLVESYPEKNRFYIVKEDDLPLEGKNVINNIIEFEK